MSSSPSKQTIFISLAITSLVLVQGVAYYGEREAHAALNWRKHTQEALLAISEVNELKGHTESLVREYVLTGDESLAGRAERNITELTRRLTRARAFTSDNPDQVRRLEQLEATLGKLTDRFTTTLATRRTQGEGAAMRLVADGTGRQLADAAETLLNEMQAEETRLLTVRADRAARFSTLTTLAMRTCGGLTFLFGLLAWRALRQQSRASTQADAQKIEAVTQFRALMENAPDAIFINQDGRIVFTNPACVRLLGLSASEKLLGQSPFGFVRADFHETVRTRIRELDAGKTVGAVEQVYVRADGTEVPVEVTASPVKYDGRPAIHVIVRDITERKRAEEAVRFSDVRYRTLFDSIDEGFCIIEMIYDPQDRPVDYRFLEISPSFEKQTGMRDARGKRMREFVPEHEEYWFATFGRVADTGEAVRLQNRAEQLHRWYDVYAFRFGEPQRRQVGILFNDITARKEAESALQTSEENLAVTLQSIGDAVLATDVEGRVTRLNAVGEMLTGWTHAEAAGHPVAEVFCIIHEETRQPAPLPIATALATGSVQGLANHTVVIAKDGTERPIADSCSPIRNREGKIIGAVLVFRDMTKEHAAEKKQRASEAALHQVLADLNRANTELAQASKLKDEFLANMSHELRTPLNAILGLSETLLEQANDPLAPRQVKAITTISTSGLHLLALINDILDLSKIEAGRLELRAEPLQLEEFCQSCLAFVRTQAMQKQVSVTCEISAGANQFQADPKRFKQVLVNLLTNAVKFTPPGGRIGLTVVAAQDEAVIHFTVWDTGIGIAASDQGKLFRAFTQVDSGLNRTQEGTGLGLALVARLMELHGGGVALESQPGTGSRFTVTLPVPATPATVDLKSGTPARTDCLQRIDDEVAAPSRQNFRRVLIIEDDPTAAEQLAHYLTGLGLSCALHPRGEEVVEAALRERPDVILMDLLLPREGGWVALAKLKEHPQTQAIPVAVVSVLDEPEKSRAFGAVAHFLKPVTREQLAAFLHRPLPQPPLPAQQPTAQAATAGPVILLAEDNDANVQTIGGYLMDKGYDLHYAMNGLTAVKLARDLRPAVILMDIQMPVMDGLTAIREIRADPTLKDIPIVALTALAMPGDRERCLSVGATEYMSKPVSLKALRTLIKQLVPPARERRPA